MKLNWSCLLLPMIVLFVACGPDKTDNNSATSNANETPSAIEIKALPTEYTIAVYSLAGAGSEKMAKRVKNGMQQQLQSMPKFWVSEMKGGAVINYGRYKERKEADTDLAVLKDEAKAGRISANLLMIVRLSDQEGQNDPLNLASQKDEGYYSLQIEMYADEDRKKAMQQAQQKVSQLRNQGVKAFYYHGELISYVTVGVFAYQDVKMQKATGTVKPSAGDFVHLYTPEIKSYGSRFPHLQLNGEKVEMAMSDEQKKKHGVRFRKTQLVQIPGAERSTEVRNRQHQTGPSAQEAGIWTMP